MQDIKTSKAAVVYKLLGRFLKDSAGILKKTVSGLCNLSISRWVFLNACIVAKLKSIFKRGKKTDSSNYRSISLHPVISKIIEKVVHDQTNAFLSDENILYNYQSGFEANHSKNICLSFLKDNILKGFDKGLLTGMIFIDLQKAFDTMYDENLLQILKAIRFSKTTIQWFRSYLSGRIFLVNIKSKLPDFGNISYGVPQGSILSPLLFVIYVSNMPQAVKSTLLLYEDDSHILH